MRALIPVALIGVAPIATPLPAAAAERHWSVGSVERVRVEAPATVRIVVGAGTGVRAAADKALVDALEVTASGGTLVIRLPHAAARRDAIPAGGVTVTVATPRLSGVAVYAAATVTASAVRADRVMLANAGSGTLAIERIDAPELVATLAGEGSITLAGKAGTAKLVANGPGTLEARALAVDRLAVQANGDSVVHAAARFEAQVTAGQAAQVDVAGQARCTVRATQGASVRCAGR